MGIVEKDGARGERGSVQIDSDGLFKGLVVGLPAWCWGVLRNPVMGATSQSWQTSSSRTHYKGRGLTPGPQSSNPKVPPRVKKAASWPAGRIFPAPPGANVSNRNGTFAVRSDNV